MPYLVSMLIGPAVGLIIDNCSNKISIAAFGSFVCVCSFVLQLQIPNCDQCYLSLAPLCLQGFSFCLYSILNYSILIVFMVPLQCIGTAYGLNVIFQNLGLFVFPQIAGAIKDGFSNEDDGFWYLNLFYIVLSGISFILSLVLIIYDRKYQDSYL